MASLIGDTEVRLPRSAVRFPIELRRPSSFQVADVGTWPRVDGRLELVAGRLLYMPPCGDIQQDVAVDVVYLLRSWAEEHQEFIVGGNEAGMLLGGEVRGAEAAVWRRDSLAGYTGGHRRVPPLVAAEVAGQDEGEEELREKARWYLDHGVREVWIVLPASREVVVLHQGAELRLSVSDSLASSCLPGFRVTVPRFFAQLDRRSSST